MATLLDGMTTHSAEGADTNIGGMSAKIRIESQKAIKCVKKAVEACFLAGTLAMGATPAMAQEQQNPVALLQTKGFSPEVIKSVVALSDFVREKQANGGLAPTEAVSIINVTPLTPDGKGLDQLVNTGSKLSKKTFMEVTNQTSLTIENYNAVVEALFDSTDIDLWLTRTDGTQMNEQEKADYRTTNEATKKRWLAKLPEFIKAGKQDVIARWFELFNTLATKLIHGSRVELQRGFIASNSMANFSSISPQKQGVFASSTATQTAEYNFMINSNAKLIKIERQFNEPGEKPFTLKYLVADDASLKEIGFPEGITVNALAFEQWKKDQQKTYDSYLRSINADKRLVESEKQVLLSKQYGEYVELHEIGNNLAKIIQEQFDQLPSRRTDTEFIISLNSNLQSWKALKRKVEVLVASEAGKLIDPESKTNFIALLDKVLLNARLNGLG